MADKLDRSSTQAARRRPQTLAGLAGRTIAGEDFHHGVREFLDEFALAVDQETRITAIDARPEPTGDRRADAFLAALAEHLAQRHDLPRPSWATEPERFLERFWFVSRTPGFRAIAIAQAPAAFRRRGVFIPARSLVRV